jgi:bacteriocin-like protein
MEETKMFKVISEEELMEVKGGSIIQTLSWSGYSYLERWIFKIFKN